MQSLHVGQVLAKLKALPVHSNTKPKQSNSSHTHTPCLTKVKELHAQHLELHTHTHTTSDRSKGTSFMYCIVSGSSERVAHVPHIWQN